LLTYVTIIYTFFLLSAFYIQRHHKSNVSYCEPLQLSPWVRGRDLHSPTPVQERTGW